MTRGYDQHRYSSVAIALHWTIALLIIFNLVTGLFHDSFSDAAKASLMGVHKWLGLMVLLLSVLRLAWRLMNPAPAPLPTHQPWERALTKTAHVLFYVLMIALPLSGWLMVSAGSRKYPISVFGAFDIPFLPVGPNDKAVGGFNHEAHEIMGWVMVILLAIHIGAVIKHHFLDRDRTWHRMSPRNAR